MDSHDMKASSLLSIDDNHYDESMEEEALLDPDEALDLEEEEFHPSPSSSSTFCSPQKPSAGSNEESEYVLGTIIVRVVAARGLDNPNRRQRDSGGFAGVFRNSSQMPTTNPYASLKFGKTTQRTSEVYATLDPVWPRDEVFFMDVSLPNSQVTHASSQRTGAAAALYGTETLEEDHHSLDNPQSLEDPFCQYQKPQNTVLTVAIFHTEMGQNLSQSKYNPTKGGMSGDSDDTFLGMASIDLTALLTGKVAEVDEWIPLHGTLNDPLHHNHHASRKGPQQRAAVRVFCEYEVTDVPPNPGDFCTFTKFCHPRDLYPLEASRAYKVDRVDRNGDIVLLSYQSPEGWVLSFQAHKKMLICEERHVSPIHTAQDELQTLGERLSVSPLVVSVAEAAERVIDEGLVGIAESIVRGSAFVFDRWFKGGVDTVLEDIQDVTNFDGRHNRESIGDILESPTLSSTASTPAAATVDEDEPYPEQEGEALPNMPPCPITGFPMIDPVVAADGHTYERTAIARWLRTSDKSPMTGSVLFHKELVPNYGLMSSIQEAADRNEEPQSFVKDDDRKPPPK